MGFFTLPNYDAISIAFSSRLFVVERLDSSDHVGKTHCSSDRVTSSLWLETGPESPDMAERQITSRGWTFHHHAIALQSRIQPKGPNERPTLTARKDRLFKGDCFD